MQNHTPSESDGATTDTEGHIRARQLMEPTDQRHLVHSVGADSSTMDGEVGEGPLARLRSAWRSATKGTVVSSIFILLTTCIGAGTLSLPYAMSQGGIFVFSIIFFLIMIMSVYVGGMLLSSKRYCSEVFPKMEVWSYEDLAYASFGVLGRIASLLTIAVLLFLALIAYMIYTRDQLAAVIHFIVDKETIDSCTPLLNCGILMCMAFIPIFPVTLLRKLTPLQFTSYLSIVSIVLVAILIMVSTIKAHIHGTIEVDTKINFAPQSFRGVITVISYCGLAFICHFNLLPLQKELTGRQTKAKLYTIVVGSIVMAYVIYNLVIFSAYFNFYGCVQSDVMLNYDSKNVIITVARAFLFVTILMHYPVLLHPTRSNINGAVYLIYKSIRMRCTRTDPQHLQSETKALLVEGTADVENSAPNKEVKVPTIPWFVETLVLFSATFIIATFISDVGKVWNFVGSTAGVLVLYIYPSAFYLRLRYIRYKKRAQKLCTNIRSQYNVYAVLKELVAWVILLIGLVLLVVENYQAIYAVVDGGSTPTNCTSTDSAAGTCYVLSCENETNATNVTSNLNRYNIWS